MHAVLVSFQSAIAPAEMLLSLATVFMASAGASGLATATWASNGYAIEGFLVFEDAEAAERYLAGESAGVILMHPAFSQFRIEHLDVMAHTSTADSTF